MFGMKNPFHISDSIKIREVDIAGVACIIVNYINYIVVDLQENNST